jgi:hypothetical protein
MNLPEFKAWFEGFTENLDGVPNAKQWKRITEKISKITDAPPVEQHIFHDYYYRPWRRWYEGSYYAASSSTSRVETRKPRQAFGQGRSSVALQAQAAMQGANDSLQYSAALGAPSSELNGFDSGAAFRELGRAEARSIRK